jgi:autotransporter-associated beta strand protein
MKTTITSKLGCIHKVGALTLALLAASTVVTRAADIFWSGPTADYTNTADWVGGVVPGPADRAVNTNGIGNVVQISAGNPDWTVNKIWAGNGVGSGAFVQNGQSVNLTTNAVPLIPGGTLVPTVRLGITTNVTGSYTLNGGSLNYSNGLFNVGELGTGILNVNGGSIIGNNTFTINNGINATTIFANASMDAGTNNTGNTWFEQGLYTPDPTLGVPTAGSTIVSASQADHSYTMAPSYKVNDAVMINSQVTNGTITPTSPALFSALSFAGSSGNGPLTIDYKVHHAAGADDTGSIIVGDWFGSGVNVLGTGGRVNVTGNTFASITAVGGNPHIWSMDVTVTNTASPVTSIDLFYNAGSPNNGGRACLLAVSGSNSLTGGAFSPIAMTGYNEDMIVEAVPIYSTVTDTVTQTGGDINTGNGQFIIGSHGTGIYNLSGGTLTVSNRMSLAPLAVGSVATVNITGGSITNITGNNLFVGTGNGSQATWNQSAGSLTLIGASQFLAPQSGNATTLGTVNLSGTAVLNLQNWIAIGRNGGVGVLNISGNAAIIRRDAFGGNFDIAGGGPGTVNQNGGAVTNIGGQTWIGENATAIWNLNSGIANLGTIHIAQTGSGIGTLNVNGGLLIAAEITTGNSLGFSTLNLNGGTVQAAADNANFLHDVSITFVRAGGAIFDSHGFNITVAESLLDDGSGGGLTNNGSGTLTLKGANTYSGATVVNAGTLNLNGANASIGATVNAGTLNTTTASTGGGGYTVASGAALGVQVVGSLNSQLNVSSLTLASSVTTNSFDLGNFGNPTSAPLNVSGAFANNGTVTINIADAKPQLGQFPLIKYGSGPGPGSYVLGTLPVGATASLSNNLANSSIDLVFVTVNAPRWEGLAGGNWDIGLTTNWINIGDGLPSVYTDGTPVVFDDEALGTTIVNLAATVSPSVITMNNGSLPYTFTGTGKISGSIG